MIQYDVLTHTFSRQGYVIRRLSQIETVVRMAQIVVEVPDPLGLETGKEPLLLGSQVSVVLQGKPLKEVIEIPRTALLNQNQVWVFEPQNTSNQEGTFLNQSQNQELSGRLLPKTVSIIRRRKESVLIDQGLSPSDQIITSRISTPVPQMKLRARSQY